MIAIHKKDKVVVLSGKSRGKQGEVVQVLQGEDRVLISKINFVKRHSRPTQTAPGGIREKEASIHISNVMLIDKKVNKPTRFGVSILNDGTHVRISKKSQEVI